MELKDISVPQDQQRQGYGKQALDELKDRAKDMGAERIVSYPGATEVILLGFLEKNGFKRKSYDDPGKFYTLECGL